MCGIAGIFSPQSNRVDPALLLKMTTSIRHRGPDDEGFLLVDSEKSIVEHRRGDETIPEVRSHHILEPFADGAPNLALGWRRLAIIDLSPTGHQPMSNGEQTVWIIFNGEIYNYIELREELLAKGYVFRTKTDSEVIIQAYEEWGMECLNRFNGMWAFALWDGRAKKLICARDRFGVKPFYYFKNNDVFTFASEIKALLLNPAIARKANHQAVFDYLAHSTIDHTDETMFSGIKQLLPAHYLAIDGSGTMEIRKYYTLECNSELGSYDEAENKRHTDKFKELLFDSVKLRLRTDVPLGSCLSGGLDSSTIVCMANTLMVQDGVIDRSLVGEHQKTFTAEYDNAQFSEKSFVDKVIARTNAQSHFVHPDGKKLWGELEEVIYHQDEPFNSTSVYAQWNVMRLAHKNGMKVLLDGQGGDELLGGYAYHVPIYQAELLRRLRFKTLLAEIRAASTISQRSAGRQLVDLLGKTARNIFPDFVLEQFTESRAFMNPDFSAARKKTKTVAKRNDSLQERLLQEETRLNLQQLLHYEDRNSMAFSIEARVPFLDYRVVEYGMQIPVQFKIHNGWSKYPLRCAAEGIIPKEVQWRKDKMGFVTPQNEWMQMLQPQIHTLLFDEPLRAEEFLNQSLLRRQFQNDPPTISNSTLWRIVNLELWMRRFHVG